MSIKKLFRRENWPALFILALAAGLRIASLDLKPPHFDEGVNGLFIDRMADTGYYAYDPGNYHGPLHFYVLYFAQALLGRNLWAIRLPMALLSVVAVGLTLGFEKIIGRNAARWAALALAVSPGAVFYGRYAIHETWLLVALLLMALGVCGLWKNGDRRSLWALVGGVTLAVLTKETYVIHLACFLLAVPALRFVELFSPSETLPWPARQWRARDLSLAIGVGVAAVLLFYAGFGLNPGGLKGLYQTFALWMETGQAGKGHEKGYFYWMELFGRYEWAALTGLAGGLALLWPGVSRAVRYLWILGLGTVAAYALVPYKTPWCILVMLWPFLLVFGHVVAWLGRLLPRSFFARAAAGLVLLASLVSCGWLNFHRYDDGDEPYVYVQTFREIHRFTDPLFALVALDPANSHLPGSIRLASYHPLPWVLGDFTAVSYHGENGPATEPAAAFILVDKEKAPALEKTFARPFYRRDLRLRSGQKPIVAYFDARKFAQVFSGPPDFVPKREKDAAP